MWLFDLLLLMCMYSLLRVFLVAVLRFYHPISTVFITEIKVTIIIIIITYL